MRHTLACILALGLLTGLTLQSGCSDSKPASKKAAATEPKASPDKPADKPVEPTAQKPDEGKTAAEPKGTPYTVKVPAGLPPLAIPDDNPMTVEKVALGKMLYFDKRLSKDGTVSCATCHDPKMAWAEKEPVSTGIGKQKGGRNSPTVINAAYATAQFWDGRAKTLEEQALGPIANPIEMGQTLEAMIADLDKIEDYKGEFKKVFGTGVTQEGVAKAIAAFERTVLSGNAPYDRFAGGEKTALSEAQQRGLETFKSAGCADCHAPGVFSNFAYYNVGVGCDKEKPDVGRMEVSKKESDKGKFRVPALREVANTAPYFHDGSAATLADAVALMAGGGKPNENLSAMMKAVKEAELTADDQKDLVEFLTGLSGEFPIVD